jgi:LemA protein
MMKALWITLGVIAVLLAILIVPGCGVYNRAVALDESAENAWANVETVLQRRYDLIPNLVNTVKGFAKQEQQVLTEITRLRSQWGEAKTAGEQVQAASQLEGALARLMVVVERYPELKSNQNFLALQDELAGTENRISVERRRYNDAVRAYNTVIRRFPANFYAKLFGFKRRTAFEATAGAEQAPTVEF